MIADPAETDRILLGTDNSDKQRPPIGRVNWSVEVVVDNE